MKTLRPSVYAILLALASTLPAHAAGKVEPIGAFEGAAPEWIRQTLEGQGHRVTLSGGAVFGDIWLRKEVSGLDNAAFVGVLTLPADVTDFRGQKVKKGTYSLRYGVMPSDGNHLGAAPSNDFLLLIPIQTDTEPAGGMSFGQLTKMSAATVGTNHPAALYLSDASAQKDYPAVATNSYGHEVFFVKLKKAGGAELPIGIVVKGRTDHV